MLRSFSTPSWWIPDSWIESNKGDDEATLSERMVKPDSWKWQWNWLQSRIRGELARPTSLDNIQRALRSIRFSSTTVEDVTEAIAFSARFLGSQNPEVRGRAAEMTDMLQSFFIYYHSAQSGIDQGRLKSLLAAHADDMLAGLDDERDPVVNQTLMMLETAGRHLDRAVSIIARDPARFSSPDLVIPAMGVLLQRADDPSALDAMPRIKPMTERARVGFWTRVLHASVRRTIPEPLLARADQAMRDEPPGNAALYPLLRLRVTGRHARRA